jgi:phosphatidylglycerophosphatase A
MLFISRILATGIFVGYVPVAPGTFGSVLAVLLYWLLPYSESPFMVPVIVLLFFAGVWASGRMEISSGIKDDQSIVIDEIVGQLITLTALEKSLKWLAIGLIIFRLFDILKPFPVKQAEKLPRGWGVMMDDVAAGLYGLITMAVIRFLS